MVSESRGSSNTAPLLLNPSPTPPDSPPIDPMDGAAAAPAPAGGGGGEEVSDREARFVHVGDPDRTSDRTRPSIGGNSIRTTKYNVLTFIPRNLYEQFRRVAYIYFFILACLNQIPQLTVFGRSTAFVPLAVVVFLTALKDGYEDWQRHRSDITENKRLAAVLQHPGTGFDSKKWKDIRVGEIIRAGADETLPCDMVLLATSDPSGAAYVNTINLDGESNLKTRYAMQEMASRPPESWLADPSSPAPPALIRCEPPNLNIYGFHATIEVDGRRIPLGPTNIVLRGCEIKNTSWVVGVAVYTGMDTKVMLNNSGPPSKRSRLETRMNREIIILAVIMVAICSLVATLTGVWLHVHRNELDTLPYFRRADFSKGGQQSYMYSGLALEIVIAFLKAVFNFQNFIPISLYISMELSRLSQSFVMTQDKTMSHEGNNFQCRALNINEDLGQIGYVFSDKTGTLTENKMVFQCASVCGVDYSNGELPVPGEVAPHPTLVDGQIWRPKMLVRTDRNLSHLLESGKGTDEWMHASNFLLAAAACSTIVPQVVETSDPTVKLIDYQGESPDEQALVYAAAAYGFVLIERTSGNIVIDVLGERQRFDVLGLHEFDSVRKRMSVVVRCPDKTIKLFVKGADVAMFSIIDKSRDLDIVHDTETHIHAYSSLGLRTLVIGMRELSWAEFEDWRLTYEKASTALSGRVELLQAIAVKVECNIRILGATGIEDKLQQGVPEAIESIRQAGIKVWVLTGDKQETAISIGYSSKLLTDSMTQIIINSQSKESCKKSLDDAISLLKKLVMLKDERGKDPARVPHALIIDGPTLVHILETELEEELFNVATACDVVLCCRVAPLQKAGIVAIIKKRTSDITLSIGDGANDVSMIQMADVGIGISGQEGRQAVMASDFSMGQFRFLVPLLFVHGHWNYQRMSYMILYNYYRNAVFVFVIVWFVFYTAFGLQNPITETSGLLYSALYTALPTIMVGIYDQDVSRRTLLKFPQLYRIGPRGESYNSRLFVLIMIDSLWQSLVLFYIPFFFYRHSVLDDSSFGDIWILGVVGLVNLHLAMDVIRWNWILHAIIWGCSILTVICIIALDSSPLVPGYMAINHLARSGTFWLCLLSIFVLALLPRFAIKSFNAYLRPNDIRIAREYEKFWKPNGPASVEDSTNHTAGGRQDSSE